MSSYLKNFKEFSLFIEEKKFICPCLNPCFEGVNNILTN